jgi:hypothetical protein
MSNTRLHRIRQLLAEGRDVSADQGVEVLDSAIAEIRRLQGENDVLRGLLRQCADVLIHCEPESTDEQESLERLHTAVHHALTPVKGDLL